MKRKFQVDTRLLTDIFAGRVYKGMIKVIPEYVANAYDAGAQRVDIFLPKPLEGVDEPLIVKDNGSGVNLRALLTIAVDRREFEDNVLSELNRLAIGERGIGRFAGFAVGKIIEYHSMIDGKHTKIQFRRDDMERAGLLGDYECTIEEDSSELNCSTEVRVYGLFGEGCYPEPEQVAHELVMDFGISELFKIYVNEEEATSEKIPEADRRNIDYKSDAFGHVTGFLVDLATKPKRIKPGVIIRVNNRRADGPTFLGLESDYDKHILNRVIGEINADELKGSILGYGYSLNRDDSQVTEFYSWLKTQLESVVRGIEVEKGRTVEDEIRNIPEFKKRWERLTPKYQERADKFLKVLSPKLGYVAHNKRILRLLSVIILRAVESSDFALVLAQLEEAEDKDVSELAKVLRTWGIREVATISSLVQNRRRISSAFSKLINNVKTLELQHLHQSLEDNLWILDDRYTVFASNRSLKKVAEQLKTDFKDKASGKRPDLILKGLFNDYVIVELKRPGHAITLEDMSQLIRYKKALVKMQPHANEITGYLIGTDYEEVILETYPRQGNVPNVYCWSLNEIVQSAERRLEWLEENLEVEVEEEQAFEELLVELGLVKAEAKK